MTKEELDKVLQDHKQWLSDNTTGKRADLRYANLRGVDLRGVDLRGVDLRYANLRCANLRGADLSSADLRYANLRGVDLRGAYLRGADLKSANLRCANLRCANLRCANLRYADLKSANLRGADLRYCSGLSVNYSANVLCEFSCGLSIHADIIYIGCKQHTVMEWQSYIESGMKLYVNECKNEKSHDQCIDVIKQLITISETRKV